METRRTSGLVVLGFLSSLLVYGSFVASAIMTTILTIVDRDRSMCSVTGISARDLKDLLFALQITSMSGLGLAALPALLSAGGCLTVFGDRLKKKGLSLAAVAIGLTIIAAVGHTFFLFKNPTTRLGQVAAPFEMSLSGEKGTRTGTIDFLLTLRAPSGSLDAAKGYQFSLLTGDYRDEEEIQDVTELVLAALREGKQTVQVAIDGVRFKGGGCSVAVHARPKGSRPTVASEVTSPHVYVYTPNSDYR